VSQVIPVDKLSRDLHNARLQYVHGIVEASLRSDSLTLLKSLFLDQRHELKQAVRPECREQK